MSGRWNYFFAGFIPAEKYQSEETPTVFLVFFSLREMTWTENSHDKQIIYVSRRIYENDTR